MRVIASFALVQTDGNAQGPNAMSLAEPTARPLKQERPRPSLAELRRLSAEARRLIVRAVHTAGAGHIGGPLSATDLLITLYFDTLNIDPRRPDWPERDRFILSKGTPRSASTPSSRCAATSPSRSWTPSIRLTLGSRAIPT